MKHFKDYWPLYMFLALFVLTLYIVALGEKYQNLQTGKITIVNNCEFIKFYKGNSEFQYIHNPKCPNCAGNK